MARVLPLALLLLLVAAGCTPDADPDRRIADGGVLADGWSLRLDEPTASPSDVRLTADGDALVGRNGPNVTFWRSGAEAATPPYTLRCEVVHMDSHEHPHGAGLVFGGTDMTGEGVRYTYFLVQEAGKFLIKRRDDAEQTMPVTSWTAHDAIRTRDGDTPAHNLLEVEVAIETTTFRVNGQTVYTTPTSSLHAAGRFGLRMVHNLDVRFERFEISGAGPDK
ncbi:MAG: hypothetical protein ACO4CT_00980 [Planctomycetota bacterium]